MTNLIEKALLVGFGIFCLIIFLATINPYLEAWEEFNEKSEVGEYMDFVTNFNDGVKYAIENTGEKYTVQVDGIEGTTLELNGNYAKFTYEFDGHTSTKILEYDKKFELKSFGNFKAAPHILKIYFDGSFIRVSIDVNI